MVPSNGPGVPLVPCFRNVLNVAPNWVLFFSFWDHTIWVMKHCLCLVWQHPWPKRKIIIFSQKAYLPLYALAYVRDRLLTLLLDGIHILRAICKTKRYFSRTLGNGSKNRLFWQVREEEYSKDLASAQCVTKINESTYERTLKTDQFRNSVLSLELAYRSLTPQS